MSYSNHETSGKLRLAIFIFIATLMGIALYFVMNSPGIVPTKEEAAANKASELSVEPKRPVI